MRFGADAVDETIADIKHLLGESTMSILEPYQSKAAAIRRKKRVEYLKKRNAIIKIGGIVFGGIIGICLGFLMVQQLLPDHKWFN